MCAALHHLAMCQPPPRPQGSTPAGGAPRALSSTRKVGSRVSQGRVCGIRAGGELPGGGDPGAELTSEQMGGAG